MSNKNADGLIRSILEENEIDVTDIKHRSFPGEQWFIVSVESASLPVAQSLAGSIESGLEGANVSTTDDSFVIAFRAAEADSSTAGLARGPLFDPRVDQLIQLLEARSRTSDALPSLRYVEDPRASLASAVASRHHIIYGRRGVGKTALLLEAKRWAEARGHAAAWVNAHVLRDLHAAHAALTIVDHAIAAVLQNAGTSTAAHFEKLRTLRDQVGRLRAKKADPEAAGQLIPELNQAFRSALREDTVRLYVFIDDFYLMPLEVQPYALDVVSACLRDSNGWIKVASIERLSRSFEPSTRIGLEVPHDATRVDLDVTLEEPAAAQTFLETVLDNYLSAVGIETRTRIAKKEALGRLVLASGGVPRDYLNLIAGSITVAREARSKAREIGKEDVAVAAGRASRGKKRDLEQDVDVARSGSLLTGLESLTAFVKDAGYTYFRFSLEEKTSPGYEVLAQLVDMRFAHLIQSGLSDKYISGVKYEVYVLDLSEYSDIRLKRGLHVLDLADGLWSWRLTGKAGTHRILSGTQLRDALRSAPVVEAALLGSLGTSGGQLPFKDLSE